MLEKLKQNKELMRIIKYLFSAGSSFALDLLLFTIFHFILMKTTLKETVVIFIATALARVLSSIYNYMINSRLVFKDKSKKGIIGYFILVVTQMLISASLVALVKKLLPANATIIKFFIDIIIFVVNYFVQKHIVFDTK